MKGPPPAGTRCTSNACWTCSFVKLTWTKLGDAEAAMLFVLAGNFGYKLYSGTSLKLKNPKFPEGEVRVRGFLGKVGVQKTPFLRGELYSQVLKFLKITI